MQAITIIGSGLAGYTLAREIRKLDKDIALRIITADDGNFYSKPMLSNALTKNLDASKLVMTSAADMAAQLNMEIITHTRIDHIDRDQHRVVAEAGAGETKSWTYSSLILANGAQAIRIPLAGDAAADILSVNSLHDYRIFRTRLASGKHITILGAGLIGCEFANDLINTGYRVSLIDLADKPLGRLLPEQAARHFQHRLGDAGIDWHLGCSLQSVDHAGDQYRLTLNNQTQFNTDLVLSAIGLKADIRLAAAAGINTGRGIITNHHLQTSDPHIYALGDCLEFDGMVLPFVMPIMIGARALAKTLLGENTDVSYPPMPVVVKTPALPVVVCPPAPDAAGSWQEETVAEGIQACYDSPEKKLLGFALTGGAVAAKQKLVKRMQDDAITDG